MPHPDVTLQISLTSGDLPHARRIVPHQLRQLGGQVHDVLLTIDRQAAATQADAELDEWLAEVAALHPRVVARDVDHSDDAVQQVADVLFGGRRPPRVDFRGRPIHSYLEPLLVAPTDWVFHLDSDMFLGGGSQTWVAEACDAIAAGDDYVLGSPYPGPPRPDGAVLRQPDASAAGPFAVRLQNMSSRVFLLHRPSFISALAPLPLLRAPLKGRLWTLREPNPPFEKLELMVTARMRELSLRRIDLLGSAPGMWSLHPPYRSPEFYRRLDELVQRVESNDLPLAQQGDFDLNDSVIDWSDARRRIRRERISTMALGRRI
jgi:hypothetical protein